VQNAAQEEGVQAGDPGLDQLAFRHGGPPQ
jgi:hypothetical protein